MFSADFVYFPDLEACLVPVGKGMCFLCCQSKNFTVLWLAAKRDCCSQGIFHLPILVGEGSEAKVLSGL